MSRIPTLLALGLLPLSACLNVKDSAAEDDTGGDLDSGDTEDTADDTGDTGDTEDTGDTGDTGVDEEAPCGAYNHVGEIGAVTEWIYYLGGGYVSTETAWDPTTGIVTSVADHERHAADHVEYAHVTWEHRCDAGGLWAEHSYSEWTREYDGGTTSVGWTDIVFDNALMGVAELDVGVTWGSTSTQTTTEEIDGVLQDPVVEEIVSDVSVIQLTTLTVVGGTFEAWEVSGFARGVATTFYLSPEVGAVKNNSGELVSFTP